MRMIWWALCLVFLLSCATMFAVRSSGYTSASQEDGKYYLHYRASRVETTQSEYETVRWRNRISGTATATMFGSLFALIGLDAVRSRNRAQ